MKNTTIVLVMIIAAVFVFGPAGVTTAGAGESGVSQEDFQKILKKMDELTRQNKKLMDRVKRLESGQLAPAGGVPGIESLNNRIELLENKERVRKDTDLGVLKEEVEELSDLMQVVEKKSLMDRVQLGVELRTRADWFDYKSKEPVRNFRGIKKYNRHREEEVHALMSNRLRLNLKAEISDNLKFHGRLTMYRNWNDDDAPVYDQNEQGRNRDDGYILVERAYADYFFKLHEKLPMALTFGRLPMADGLPTDLREDRPRKSTFPSLAYEIIADGAALTVMTDEVFGLKQSAFRFIYLRTNPDNDGDIYRKQPYNFEENNLYIGQFETRLPGKYLEDILAIVTLSYNPDQPSINLTKSGIFKVVDLPDSLGSFYVATLYFQAKRFLGSNFDWFAGFGYTDIDGSGRPARYRIGPIPVNVGLTGPDNKRSKSGRSVHAGMRYTFPIEVLNNPKLGIEYNWGSKYWFSAIWASEDPLNKLALNGYCWDFYYIQPLNKNLLLRLGYTFLKREYPLVTARTQPSRFEEKVQNLYFLLDARF